MGRIEPDMSVFRQMQKQPEFHEQIWQYINRRVSDCASSTARKRCAKMRRMFARIEQDFGVERGTLLALWGLESAYRRSVVRQKNHMRPVFPSLAALAWNEPRRRRPSFGNRVDQRVEKSSIAAGARRTKCAARGPARWGIPSGCPRSGSCRHGLRQGRPRLAIGRPDDALGSSARYLVNRGKYHRGDTLGS